MHAQYEVKGKCMHAQRVLPGVPNQAGYGRTGLIPRQVELEMHGIYTLGRGR